MKHFNVNDLGKIVEKTSEIGSRSYDIYDVYDTNMQAIRNQSGGLYFIDVPGVTGKTFLISIIVRR
jgi:hypothetical protein